MRTGAIVGLVLLAWFAGGTGVATAADGRQASNERPLAEAGLDQRVAVGTTVYLDGTGSRDPDGRVAGYEWRLDTPEGVTIAPADTDAGRTSFVARRTGRYAVTVVVTDDDGARDADTLYVRVGPGGDAPADPGSGPSSGPAPVPGPRVAPPDRTVGGPQASPVPDRGRSPTTGASTLPNASAPPSTPTPSPWVRIEGPSVLRTGTQGTWRVRTGGWAEGARVAYRWGSGGTGQTTGRTLRAPGTRTFVAVVGDGRTYVSASHRVRVVANRPPTIDIARPAVSPGARVGLSATADDPDGRVVEVAWAPGQTVTAPTNGSRAVSATATDDEGATATDRLLLTATRSVTHSVERIDVTCYYHSIDQQYDANPDRCQIQDGVAGGGTDHHAATSHGADVAHYLADPFYDVHWRRVAPGELEEYDAGEVPDDLGVAAEDVSGDVDDVLPEGLAERLRAGEDVLPPEYVNTTVETSASAHDSGSLTIGGRTVTTDLTGDGTIDAADWDRRFREHDGTDDRSVLRSIQAVRLAGRAATETVADGGGRAAPEAPATPPSDAGDGQSRTAAASASETDDLRAEASNNYAGGGHVGPSLGVGGFA